MNYNLSKKTDTLDQESRSSNIQKITSNWVEFWQFLKPERVGLITSLFLIAIESLATVLGPYLIAQAIDGPIKEKNVSGLLFYVGLLFMLFLVSVISSFFQTRIMGIVAQNTLLLLRTSLFGKIQELPLAFFNQNQSGDLTSRINNDADKLNQLLSESILRFLGNFSSVLGIGIFILFLNLPLALVTLSFLIPIIILTQLISPFVENYTKKYQIKIGELASEIQCDLDNFRVIVAFDRRQYFEDKLIKKIQETEQAGRKSEFFANIFRPIYDVFSSLAVIGVMGFGFWQLQNGQIEIGLLVGFVAYANNLYGPLRILGSIWGNIQSSLGAWERVREILDLKSDLVIIKK